MSIEEGQITAAFCSHCLDRCTHTQTESNWLVRDVYACDGCGERTLPCRLCSDAFAAGSASYDNDLCSVCASVVVRWEVDTLAPGSKWCSWCYRVRGEFRAVMRGPADCRVYQVCAVCPQNVCPQLTAAVSTSVAPAGDS